MPRPISFLPETFPLKVSVPWALLWRVVDYAKKRGLRRPDALRELLELGLEAAGAQLRAGQHALIAGKGETIEFRCGLDRRRAEHLEALDLFEARARAIAESPRQRLDRLRAEKAEHDHERT